MKKRAEKRYMSRLIFVLNVIGGESGASFLNLSQSEVTQKLQRSRIIFDF